MRFSKNRLGKWTFLQLLIILSLLAALYIYAPQISPNTDASSAPTAPEITVTDADRSTEESSATIIQLPEPGGIYTITDAGNYLLQGTFRGTITVDAQEQIVHLILNGVDIESPSGPALNIISAGKVIITLCGETVNNFRDSGLYPQGSEADACIYSTCDLTFNGTGDLNISGYYKDAIHTKDILKILDGNIFAQAKRDGLHGNDGILIASQSLRVESERHGLNSTKNGKPAKGNIEICQGENTIIAGGYAVSCAADLYVDQCSLYALGILDTFDVLGQSYIAEGVLD